MRRGEFVGAAAVLGSWLAVRSGRLEPYEARVAAAQRRGGPTVDRVMAHLTDLGSVYGIVGTSAALAATGRPRLARDVAASGGIAWGVAQAAKPLLQRPRPFETGTPMLVSRPAGTSWPSGHSAVAAAIGTTIAATPGPARGARRLLGAGLAAYVGGSRLHVGVHHPTDVVAGFGVGVVAAAVWQRTVRRFLS